MPGRSKKKTFKISAKAEHRPYREAMSNKKYAHWENSSGGKTLQIGPESIADPGSFFKRFYSFITRFYPAAGAAVWTWKNLCATKQEVKFVGENDANKNRAKTLINELDKQISPFHFVKSGGMDFLISQFFKYIFTYGRFSGTLVLDPNNKGVLKFEIGDPFKVKFSKDRIPYVREGKEFIYRETNENTFYYFGLNMDWENPYGSAMIDGAWETMNMAKEMLNDMRLASGNAGLPRLHIKIGQPAKGEGEDDEDYITRINTYFDSYVNQLVDLAPDDNFYSWDDVKVATIGGFGGGGGFVWRNNRQVLDEEIISAFHLFPWVVGKSSQTTKNWVRSQFDLLLAQVEAVQNEAKRFAEWIRNTHLLLNGITDVQTSHHFSMLRDPSQKDMAIAERFQIANVKSLILMGMITSDDGARRLGEDKAADPELIFKAGDDAMEPIDKGANAGDDPDINPSLDERLDVIETKIDEIVDQNSNGKKTPGSIPGKDGAE